MASYAAGMIKRSLLLIAPAMLCGILNSCSGGLQGPVLMGDTQTIIVEGENVYQRGLAAERDGKIKKAIKLYRQTATEYPFATSAGEARYRQAQLLDQTGETLDAFEAYDQFVKSSPSSSHYMDALRRQAEIAHAAASGDISTKFLGLKSKLSIEKQVGLLTKVRDNAPKSAIAAKAQFAIGEAYHNKGKYPESVAAFRLLVNDQPNSPLAPEALFQVGKVLLENAEKGNQNQATIDLSREAFNDYLIQYPGHKRNAEARKMITSLNARETDRSFEIAEFYLKTDQFESAKIYYRDVVKRSKSGKLHDAAKARLKELGE